VLEIVQKLVYLLIFRLGIEKVRIKYH